MFKCPTQVPDFMANFFFVKGKISDLKVKHVYSAGRTRQFRFKFPPYPGMVQIPHQPGTEDSQMSVGFT